MLAVLTARQTSRMLAKAAQAYEQAALGAGQGPRNLENCKLSKVLRNDESSAIMPSKCVQFELHNVTGCPDRCTTKKAVSPYCLLSTMKLLGLEQIRMLCAFGRPIAVILALTEPCVMSAGHQHTPVMKAQSS